MTESGPNYMRLSVLIFFIVFVLEVVFIQLAQSNDKPLDQKNLAELKQELRLDRTDLKVYYHIGRTYLGLNPAPATQSDVNSELQASSVYFEDALLQISEGDQRAAVIQLLNAIKQDETNLAAYMLMAETYHDMRLPKGAEYYLRKALEHGADPNSVLVPLGQALIQQEKYSLVLADLPLAGLPKNLKARIRVLHAKAYIGQQEYPKARRVLNESIKGDNTVVEANIELARLNMLQGRADDAGRLLQTINKAAEYFADYWLIKGELARLSGDYEMALNAYRKATGLQPEHLATLHAIASLLLDLRQISQAEKEIHLIRSLYPEDLRAILLALSLAKAQQDAAAKDEIVIFADGLINNLDYVALQNDPYNLLLIGSIHYLSGKNVAGIALLSRYLDFYPANFNALKLLVTMQLKLQKTTGAAAVLEQSTKYHADNTAWLALFGQVKLQQKNYSAALEYFSRVIKSQPENYSLRLRCAEINIILGNYETALAEMQLLRDVGLKANVGAMQANILLSLGRFSEAIKLVTELEMVDGKSALLLNIAANAEIGLNNMSGAKRLLVEALALDAQSVAVIFNLATLELKAGNVAAATKGFKQVLQLQDDHVLSLVQLAGITQKRGNNRQAIKHLKKAFELRLDINNGLHLVDLLSAESRSQEAREVLTNLRAAFPEQIALIAADAALNIQENNVDRAKQLYLLMRIQARKDSSAKDLVRVFYHQLKIKAEQDAKITLALAEQIDPLDFSVLVARAELLARIDAYTELLAIANKIVDNQPAEAVGYRLKADALQSMERNDEALQVYALGVKNTDGSVSLILGYYNLLREVVDIDAAVEFLDRWVNDKRPEEFAIFRALAAGYELQGNTDKALYLAERLMQMQPDDPLLLNNLALLYLNVGDQRARELAERAYKLAPDHFAVMDTLGWVLANSGEPSLAVAMLRNAMARSANIPEIHYHYAFALYKNGQSNIAVKELQKLLASGQDFNGIAEVQALYSQLKQ
ncbi:MAG: PEP-CTERM system TPR-repeat protein PrsT [Pseudomonadales bacterium]|nr:PEP-CTERM system TPR-repeat protein PrsT [Pseudomonadales bacterium]